MISDQLQSSYDLFAPIRARFVGVGVERGGIERIGVVPVYVKRYGAYLPHVFPDIQHFRVESTFTPEQLELVNAALLAVKQQVNHADDSLCQRIVEQFNHATKPYFLLATVRAVEAVLASTLHDQPQHGATLDAIFRVAGSEGIRDVIRLYGAHMLDHALNKTAPTIPDLLAFVHVHLRETAHGNVHAEVWCPGTDLAKAMLHHMHQAALMLVNEHDIKLSLALDMEARALPVDLVHHFTTFVQRRAHSMLLQHGVRRT